MVELHDFTVGRRCGYLKFSDQLRRSGGGDDDPAGGEGDEPFVHGLVDE